MRRRRTARRFLRRRSRRSSAGWRAKDGGNRRRPPCLQYVALHGLRGRPRPRQAYRSAGEACVAALPGRWKKRRWTIIAACARQLLMPECSSYRFQGHRHLSNVFRENEAHSLIPAAPASSPEQADAANIVRIHPVWRRYAERGICTPKPSDPRATCRDQAQRYVALEHSRTPCWACRPIHNVIVADTNPPSVFDVAIEVGINCRYAREQTLGFESEMITGQPR